MNFDEVGATIRNNPRAAKEAYNNLQEFLAPGGELDLIALQVWTAAATADKPEVFVAIVNGSLVKALADQDNPPTKYLSEEVCAFVASTVPEDILNG